MTRQLKFRPAAAVLTLSLALTSGMASAGTGGTVNLRGSVATECALSIFYNENHSLDIVNGVSNLTIGSAGERCNAGNGYTVTVSSANNGVLRNERGDTVGYSINWHDTGLRNLTVPVVVTRTSARPYLTTRSFRVTVPATPQAIAGTYTDTVTMTIAAR